MPLVYAPDAPPLTKGRVFGGMNFRPFDDGMRSVPTMQAYGWNTAGLTTRTLFGCELPAGTGRLYGASTTDIYEYTITAGPTYTRTLVSKGGVPYAITASPAKPDGFSNCWQFTNFGSVILAANGQCAVPIQKQTASGAAFSDLSGAPSAACVEVFKGFLICGNISNTFGAVVGTGDMVAWSALGDYTNFVPSLATQAGNNRLFDTSGAIVAIDNLGDYCVVYKERAIYLMIYVGGTDTFAFQRISNNIGCRVWDKFPAPIVDIGFAHIFVGENDIYMFDGSRPVSITAGIRSTLGLSGSVLSTIAQTLVSHHPTDQEVYFWQAAGPSPVQLVYNYRLHQWGVISETAPVGVNISSNTSAISLLNSVDPVLCAGLVVNSIDGLLYSRSPVNGAHANATVNIGAVGDAHKSFLSTRARPIWAIAPATVEPGFWYTAKHPYRALGSWNSAAYSADSANKRIDMQATGRWHAVGVNLTGPWEMVDCDIDIQPAGAE